MPRLKPPVVAHYDFKSCTNNQTSREVAQRTRRLESKGYNIMLVPSIASSSESSKYCTGADPGSEERGCTDMKR